MNTNQIQRFATQARNILLAGVNAKLNLLGFDADGHADAAVYPKRYSDSTVFQGRVIPGTRFYDQWNELRQRIDLIGRDDVCEEAAYTWFNRLMALRILYKNGIIQPVIEYDNPNVKVPRIVTNARRGKTEYFQPSDRQQYNDIMDDDTRLFEQFQVLITAYCHNHPILKACFGGITGYTELLLPNNILVDGNFIDLLNNTDYLTDDDYRQSELIGWLYQFYISEKKDEVFASFKDGNKADADQIPAATQIFTPNWIVKYMVQNTLGRIYLDNHPTSSLASNWQYLVDSPSERGQGGVLQLSSLESLTCADLSCGSGHILGEFFEMLYQIYDEELYEPRQAVESILQNNILGIDLDTRAKQLSMFALLLKACQKDISFADAHCLPRVLDMPVCNRYTWLDLEGHMVTALQIKSGTEKIAKELEECFTLLEQARNLGSIMKFDISPETRAFVQECLAQQAIQQKYVTILQPLFDGFKLLLALTDKYSVIAMNPPYMGSGNMNEELSYYVKKNYDSSKADLATVFVEVMGAKVLDKGLYSFIIPPSWMFLPSFETFRKNILINHTIKSFLHLSNGVFGGDFGSTPCVIQAFKSDNPRGIYFRLVEKTFQLIESDHLKELFLKAKSDYSFRFDFTNYDRSSDSIKHSTNGKTIVYAGIPQDMYFKIPGIPLAYWLSEKVIKCFDFKSIKDITISDGQTKTGDNNKYLRFIWEVSSLNVGKEKKWVKHPKGGAYRRWYGNIEWVVDWSDEARDFYRKDKVARILPQYLWWKKGVSWTLLTSGIQGYRDYQDDCIFNLAAPTLFFKNEEERIYVLGLLNTPISVLLLSIFNPTINNNIGDIQAIPLIKENVESINSLVVENISISKADWDAHETSWDFQENELIRLRKQSRGTFRIGFENAPKTNFVALDLLVEEYKAYWMEKFNQLHDNEEELNRQFIEIYGLQDELSPDVPYDEVSILQQGELTFIPSPGSDGFMTPIWREDNIIQQFISYAIGCCMGRYRLDRPGLQIAHPNPTAEELAPYHVDGASDDFHIDKDAIIPILPVDAPFPDNAANRITNFVKLVFGTDNINGNMNFIQDALGMSVSDYMTKNFYTDHKKRYQNRPIYWLFSSKKGAFQCLVYMHRMDRFTVGRIRDNYLLPYIQHIENKLGELNLNAALLTSDERKEQKRKLAILQECREYDNILHLYADRQIDFDLDDGVLHNYSLFKDILAKLK